QNFHCFVRPFPGHRAKPVQEQADGFVGLSILSHYLTELDYKDQKLRLDRNEHLPPQPGAGITIVPFRTTQNGLISVETELEGGHTINAILDSGASSTVISAAAVDRLKLGRVV